ncbi:serine/threonine protein kinase [Parapedobacter pyrenivorans]|uniref:serine/threonine protein kinase n=1 Tax=Parapedobacter pyrenivorans TaxID=1305674 RepID=UPI003342C007
MIGKTIQGYRVDALLGEGGMGKVYLATDLALDRKVAIKNLNANLAYDTTFLERFTNEARILSRLSHPNIALLYNYIQVGSDHYMAMEYVEGDDMDTYVRNYGAVSPAQLVPILTVLLDGLGYAHGKGVLHRDIKPANLMLTPHGSVKIMDFGIARVSDQASRLTKVRSVIGTLDYLAPELIQGADPTPASDCYALGVVAYELATGGTLPFKGTSEFALMQAIIGGKPLPLDRLNKRVPRKLASIIGKAMAADPAARFKDTGQFRTALLRAFPNYRTIDPYLPKPAAPAALAPVPAPPPPGAPETVVLEPTKAGTPLPTKVIARVEPAGFQLPAAPKRFAYAAYAAGLAAVILVVVALVFLFWPGGGPTAGKENNTATVGVDDGGKPGQRFALATGNDAGTTATPPADVQQLIAATEEELTLPPPDPERLSGPSPQSDGNAERKPTSEENVPEETTAIDKKPEQTPGTTVNTQPENEPDVEPERIPAPMVLDGSVTVNLRLRDKLDGAQLQKGQQLSFSVTKPVTYRGYTIISKGALATAEIRRVGSRQVSIRFNDVKSVNGQTIPFVKSELSGKIEDMLASPDFIVILEKGATIP